MSGILVREQGEQNQIIGLKLEIEKIMQLIFSNSDDTYIIHRMGEDILFFDKKEKTLIAIQVKASEKVKTGYVNISEIKEI
ncbi:hypothetical protein [Spiroplasma endosymbiont of Cantharis lateralis]|uniref:hypothetical protein n=1 Tax=Spiroplasma endosymbiont of Cantharis lateralis TaxID=3066277 RepID=UPI00313B9FF5